MFKQAFVEGVPFSDHSRACVWFVTRTTWECEIYKREGNRIEKMRMIEKTSISELIFV